MAAKLRRFLIGTAIVLLVLAGPIAALDYFLPHHAVYRIVGTEIKRVEKAGVPVGPRPAELFDVRYIYAEDIETRKPHVFRNEDTGFGFPWYLKFNSADVQASAQSIANERGTAAITYYGWRIQLFSLYPNAVKIVRAEPGTWVIPWFNIIFFTVTIGGTLWFIWWIRGIFARRRLAREAVRAEGAD
ncbi:MAG: DUF1523 family protein [Beijerinckiaceae bacterium]|nr:DUF1523 family protein [Beijerinckiaceae bacterium]